MKIFALFFLFVFSNAYAKEDLPCSASVNGAEITLEKTASGLIMIAIEDPLFDTYDVVINANNDKKIKVRMAKFISTETANKLKSEISVLPENLRNEIIGLAKARVIDAVGGYDQSGDIHLTLVQGESRLDVYCHNAE